MPTVSSSHWVASAKDQLINTTVCTVCVQNAVSSQQAIHFQMSWRDRTAPHQESWAVHTVNSPAWYTLWPHRHLPYLSIFTKSKTKSMCYCGIIHFAQMDVKERRDPKHLYPICSQNYFFLYKTVRFLFLSGSPSLLGTGTKGVQKDRNWWETSKSIKTHISCYCPLACCHGRKIVISIWYNILFSWHHHGNIHVEWHQERKITVSIWLKFSIFFVLPLPWNKRKSEILGDQKEGKCSNGDTCSRPTV